MAKLSYSERKDMKKSTFAPKSGLYEMEKGEVVTPSSKGKTGYWMIDGKNKKFCPVD